MPDICGVSWKIALDRTTTSVRVKAFRENLVPGAAFPTPMYSFSIASPNPGARTDLGRRLGVSPANLAISRPGTERYLDPHFIPLFSRLVERCILAP